MRFPDHSDLGVVTLEGVGEFRVSMDRIGTVAPHPDAAGRCLCGGPWPCPDIDAPNYRPEAYARHGAAPPSEDAVPLDVDWYAEAMRWKAIAEDNIAKAPPAAPAEFGWWHPVECIDSHDEYHNCLDTTGSIIGWREEADRLAADRLGRALLAAVPGYRRWLEWPVLTTHERQSREDAIDAEVYAHANAIARWYADHE